MKWLPLTLNNVNDIDKQAEESINTLRALCDQYKSAISASSSSSGSANLHHQLFSSSSSTKTSSAIPAQVMKAISVLRQAMSARIQQLDAFYHEHDLDPRAAKLESTRLHMKKALRDLDVDASGATNGVEPSTSISQVAKPQSTSRSGVVAGATNVTVNNDPQNHHQLQNQNQNTSNNYSSNEMVAVRILMSPQEYEELRRRRDVMRNAHVRSQEYIGGATMSMNSVNNTATNLATHTSTVGNNNHRLVAAAGAAGGGGTGSLSWEHAAIAAQKRNTTSKLSPPIVRASGLYVTGNTDEDPRLQLSRSRGPGTRLNMGAGASSGHGQSFSQIQQQVLQHSPTTGRSNQIYNNNNNNHFVTSSATGNYSQQNALRNPSTLQGYRYQSPRVAATGGARSVVRTGAWSSAGVHGMSTDQLDKLRSFGSR